MPLWNQEVYETPENAPSPLGFLNVIGQSKALTSGWSGFAVKTIVVCNASGTVFGMASWMLFQGLAGPALAFLGGCGFGFVGGLVHRWRSDSREALALFRQYPELLEFHCRRVEPRVFDRITFSEWAKDVHKNPAKQGVLIAAMYSAAPALDRLSSESESVIVNKLMPQE